MTKTLKVLASVLVTAAVATGGTYFVAKGSHCVEDMANGMTVTFDGINAEQGCVDVETLAKSSRPGLFTFRRVDDNFPKPPIIECQATETQQWAGIDVQVSATWRLTIPLSTNGQPPPTAEQETAECAFLFLHGPNPHATP